MTSNYAPFVAYENWKAQMKAKLWNDSMTVIEKLNAFEEYSQKLKYGGSPNFYDYATNAKDPSCGLDCVAAADMMIDIANDLGLNGERKVVESWGHEAAFILINGEVLRYDATPRN